MGARPVLLPSPSNHGRTRRTVEIGHFDEGRLVRAARERNREAFNLLGQRYLGTVYAIVHARTKSRESADEPARLGTATPGDVAGPFHVRMEYPTQQMIKITKRTARTYLGLWGWISLPRTSVRWIETTPSDPPLVSWAVNRKDRWAATMNTPPTDGRLLWSFLVGSYRARE